jgi:hypothetical protein
MRAREQLSQIQANKDHPLVPIPHGSPPPLPPPVCTCSCVYSHQETQPRTQARTVSQVLDAYLLQSEILFSLSVSRCSCLYAPQIYCLDARVYHKAVYGAKTTEEDAERQSGEEHGHFQPAQVDNNVEKIMPTSRLRRSSVGVCSDFN